MRLGINKEGKNEFHREKEKKIWTRMKERTKIERPKRESSVMDRHVPLISVELNRSLVSSFSHFLAAQLGKSFILDNEITVLIPNNDNGSA